MNSNPSNYPPGVTGNEPEITGEHDPDVCGCKYLGNDMWDCGHVDNVLELPGFVEGEEPPQEG